ncbi:MAG: S8 family serine peptidase [Moheibacter sp.]
MKTIFILLILLTSIPAFSQEKVNPSVLEKISRESGAKYQQELSKFAADLNAPADLRADLTFRFAGYILGSPVFYHTGDSRQALATNTDLLYNNSIPGVQVTGSGMRAYIWDGGSVRTSHVDLIGRITNKNAVTINDHASGVAGVVMGAGNASSGGVNSRGMAYEAMLSAYDFGNNIAEIANESTNPENSEYLISNHSYGVITGWSYGNYGNGTGWYWFGFPSFSTTESVYFGYYGADDASLDEIAFNSPQHTIVKSAGNDNQEGPGGTLAQHWAGTSGSWTQYNNVFRPNDCGQTGFDCIPTSSLAKNIITVGAIEVMNGRYSEPSDVVAAGFTGFGPADDGRIKPDVVAVGVDALAPGAGSDNQFYLWDGTSFSAPAVTGNIVLLQQLYEQEYGTFLRSDMTKALVIHTANEAGNAPGPDYKFGWGLMDTAKAAELIMSKEETSIMENHTLNNGEIYNFSVRGIEGSPLKVTIVWLDPKGSIGTTHNERTPKLINDLDLRISDGLLEYFPWKLDVNNPASAATTGDNVLDNVEQVLIDNPIGGLNYEITVSHKGNLQNGSQVFAIIISGAAFCPSSTLWNGLAWSNGLPDFTKKAIIDGPLVMASDLEACELEVTADGSLEIPAGFSFTVNGMVSNLGAAENFVVANDGNLIQIEEVENLGEITVIRESRPMIRLDYTLWSSPVSGQNLFGFSPETVNGVTNYPGSAGRIYVYEGANGYVNPDPFTPEAVMENGVGYLFRSPNNWSATEAVPYIGTFTGVPKNGNIQVATHAGNYTSIGNPYPSNITLNDLYAANPDINTVYFWNNNHSAGNNYATCTNGLGCVAAMGGGNTPNGILTTGQGFIVHTDDSSVIFNNTMRADNSGIFFKVDELESHRFWLNLDGQNESYNQILVGYVSGATNQIDAQIDAKLFNYTGSALYNLINEEQYVIQGRALPFEAEDVVPLGFRASEGGKFKISLADFDGIFTEGNTTIYLKDNQLNIAHNLMESDYEFESTQGEFKERFEVVYETEEIMGTGDFDSNLVQVYQNESQIIVSSKTEKIVSVELFDMIGRNLHKNEKVNANLYQIKSNSKGVLVVKVQTQNGDVLTKKMINK